MSWHDSHQEEYKCTTKITKSPNFFSWLSVQIEPLGKAFICSFRRTILIENIIFAVHLAQCMAPKCCNVIFGGFASKLFVILSSEWSCIIKDVLNIRLNVCEMLKSELQTNKKKKELLRNISSFSSVFRILSWER